MYRNELVKIILIRWMMNDCCHCLCVNHLMLIKSSLIKVSESVRISICTYLAALFGACESIRSIVMNDVMYIGAKVSTVEMSIKSAKRLTVVTLPSPHSGIF